MSEESSEVDEILGKMWKWFMDGLQNAIKEGRIGEYIAEGTCALVGYNAVTKQGGDPMQGLLGSGSALIAYRLARSQNEAGAIAGVVYLSTLGLLNVIDISQSVGTPLPDCPEGKHKIFSAIHHKWICVK